MNVKPMSTGGENSISTHETTEKARCESLGILTDKPKYSNYKTISSRIASFQNWPSTKSQKIEELAEAGFGYTGVEDAVRCYFCGIGLKDWPAGAIPWEQHTLANPNCGHVKRCRGIGYIQKLTGNGEEDLEVDAVDDSGDVIDTVKEAIERNKDTVDIAKDYCSNEAHIRTAVKRLIKHDRHKLFSAVDLVRVIQEIEEQIEQKENAASNYTQSVESDTETDGEVSEKEEDSESNEDIVETNRKLKDPITCKICFDAIACIITLPCGHMVSCPQCISALTTCAVCRTPIKGTVRALMAV